MQQKYFELVIVTRFNVAINLFYAKLGKSNERWQVLKKIIENLNSLQKKIEIFPFQW